MSTPLVTIFVRHSADCKYAADEFCKRCNCRKHLRWTQNGVQYRRKASTRSWEEAEQAKRRLEDQLAGRTPAPDSRGQGIKEAVDLFLTDKKVQGITDDVIGNTRGSWPGFRPSASRQASTPFKQSIEVC